jgi:hypothetical protein
MLGRLARALDRRFGALNARMDALGERIGRLEERIDATVGAISDQGGEITGLRATLEDHVQPVLRAILDEESENRRRLYERRDGDRYAAAYDEARPLVSVTVATRDHAELLLGRALPSLLGQTHAELEILVVGDAAPPELGEAVAALGDDRVSYANLTQRVRVHEDPLRHWLVGSTMARNEAARRARGRWLLHFDDDDHLRPDAISSLLAKAREERAEVAYGGFEEHQPDGAPLRRLAFPPRSDCFGWQGALVHGELGFFERELVAAHLGMAGDEYLLERMLRAGVRFAMLDEVVWDYFPSTVWGSSSARQTTAQMPSTAEGSSSA